MVGILEDSHVVDVHVWILEHFDDHTVGELLVGVRLDFIRVGARRCAAGHHLHVVGALLNGRLGCRRVSEQVHVADDGVELLGHWLHDDDPQAAHRLIAHQTRLMHHMALARVYTHTHTHTHKSIIFVHIHN